ncbi:MAG: hypothetical protein JKY53_10065 [Flavobacteriales bacterium]|nr:hypothetical protein [Flavobacteriales bacterium]
MNLHLTHNNFVFDRVLNVFKSIDNVNLKQHKFIIYSLHEIKEANRMIKDESVTYVVYDSVKFWSEIGDLAAYDKIYIHFLSDQLSDFILKCPKEVQVVLVFWGGCFFVATFQKINLSSVVLRLC